MNTLDTLKAAVAWLSVNIDPVVPRALLVLAVLVVVYAVRKLFPRAWEAFAGAVPVPVIDAAPVLLVLSKAWQALPGTLLGMVSLALSTGGDPRATFKGAVFGALAALAHEVLKAVPWIPYRGEVGSAGLPPGASGGGSGNTPTRIRAASSGGFDAGPDDAAIRGLRARIFFGHGVLACFGFAGLTLSWALAGCARDVQPCSTEDFATGPLALHNGACAAERQAKFPDLPDEACEAEEGCRAILERCDRWVEERCK